MDCQVKEINYLVEENIWINNLHQNVINILRPIKGYAIALKRKGSRILRRSGKMAEDTDLKNIQIRAGDLVRVLSKGEIQALLDDRRKYKGCSFMDEMYNYCNNTFRVFKEVNYFYDEVKHKMVKCKNIVLLEGVSCSGNRTLYKEKCDRNCFLFWHSGWLRRVNK